MLDHGPRWPRWASHDELLERGGKLRRRCGEAFELVGQGAAGA